MNFLKNLWADSPKFVRITAIITISFFSAYGLIVGTPYLSRSIANYLLCVLYFAALGAGCGLLLCCAWKLYAKMQLKAVYKNLEQHFFQSGFTVEMADVLKAIIPAPAEREQVLRAYLLVMAEDYRQAEGVITRINEPSLSTRNFAAVMTAKLRLYLMTGRLEKAEHLLDLHRSKIEQAFEMKPDLADNYYVFADDIFDYYMLAGICAEMKHEQDAALLYRKKAMFQASNRSTGEMQFCEQLMDLYALYASGKNKEAHELENQLAIMPELVQPKLTQAQKNEMHRALEQAKVFAGMHAVNAQQEYSAERKLPVTGGAALPSDFVEM